VWVSDVERSDDSNQAVPWRPPLSLILVSVLAVGVAVVHVAFPSLTIDVVTLGLLAVAALPWLAPVVKSFRFGSLEVDLRDLQQSVSEVRSRVEESVQKVEDLSDQVQRIVFSGAVDAGTRTELETAMSGFFTHLRQAGLPLPSTEPHVEVVDKGRVTPVYYSSVIELPPEQWSPQLKAVKSGLAVYLSCSYRGSPEVAKESYELYEREAASDNQRRNLETRERQANLDSNRQLREHHSGAHPAAAWRNGGNAGSGGVPQAGPHAGVTTLRVWERSR